MEKLACDKCGDTFSSIETLAAHLKNHIDSLQDTGIVWFRGLYYTQFAEPGKCGGFTGGI